MISKEKVKYENLKNKLKEELGTMNIQIFLVGEIGITSFEGNLISVSKPSDSSVSRKLSQATNQKHIHRSVLQGYL